MATYLENLSSRYLVEIYFECRKTNTYPHPGSWGEQTAYCTELFNFLDMIVAESEYKNAKARADEAKK